MIDVERETMFQQDESGSPLDISVVAVEGIEDPVWSTLHHPLEEEVRIHRDALAQGISEFGRNYIINLLYAEQSHTLVPELVKNLFTTFDSLVAEAGGTHFQSVGGWAKTLQYPPAFNTKELAYFFHHFSQRIMHAEYAGLDGENDKMKLYKDRAAKVLEYMGRPENADLYFPISTKQLHNLGDQAIGSVRSFLQAHIVDPDLWEEVIVDDGVEFVLNEKAVSLFWQDRIVPARDHHSQVHELHIRPKGIHEYRLTVKHASPAANPDWKQVQIMGAVYDEKGKPLDYNLQLYCSVEPNAENRLLGKTRRKGEGVVSQFQQNGVRIYPDVVVLPAIERGYTYLVDELPEELPNDPSILMSLFVRQVQYFTTTYGYNDEDRYQANISRLVDALIVLPEEKRRIDESLRMELFVNLLYAYSYDYPTTHRMMYATGAYILFPRMLGMLSLVKERDSSLHTSPVMPFTNIDSLKQFWTMAKAEGLNILRGGLRAYNEYTRDRYNKVFPDIHVGLLPAFCFAFEPEPEEFDREKIKTWYETVWKNRGTTPGLDLISDFYHACVRN